MNSIAPMRRVVAFLLLGGGLAYGQSTLPPMSPTFAERVSHRADVAYSHGQLEVSADNSSLNQILRDVSRQTGMKITGAVIDEPVYGKYGPSSPAKVLASLLDGTSSNMLLRQTERDAPTELILTPRQGEATPPNPNAPGFDDDVAPVMQRPIAAEPIAARLAVVAPPAAIPAAEIPATALVGNASAVAATSLGGPVDGSSSTRAQSQDVEEPQSPNGLKTPQQIYEQLRRLQQAQLQVPMSSR